MTMDRTGEIQCPNCGRLTPIAPFCTHCGAVIPEGASAPRTHAMDRDELEERARQLHGNSPPFRRGRPAGDEAPGSSAWYGPPARERFVPEPADKLARHVEPGEADESARVDNLDERGAVLSGPAAYRPPGDAMPAERMVGVPPIIASRPAPPPMPDAYRAAPPGDAGYESDAAGEGGGYGGGYGGGEFGEPGWSDDRPPRRSSLPIIGFLVLGVAALLGGALFFSALNRPAGVAQGSSSPSASAAASAGASESPNASPSAAASGSGGGSQAPSAAATADNFTARAQPCASNDMGFSGCSKDGTTLNGSQVWVWVGFKNGQAANVLGVTIVNKAGGSEVGDGSLELDKLNGCDPGKTCSGYIQMTFGDLSPGSYTIQVSRDGAQVATTEFMVKA
jgi:hypothetical protein